MEEKRGQDKKWSMDTRMDKGRRKESKTNNPVLFENFLISCVGIYAPLQWWGQK